MNVSSPGESELHSRILMLLEHSSPDQTLASYRAFSFPALCGTLQSHALFVRIASPRPGDTSCWNICWLRTRLKKRSSAFKYPWRMITIGGKGDVHALALR